MGIRTHDGRLLEATMLMSIVLLMSIFDVDSKFVAADFVCERLVQNRIKVLAYFLAQGTG
jgi:hypothetical protein